tara:strand:+ start:873 stop:1250 length:378 start_codon:yes stop_codon:yes gene_type:complete
MAYLKKQDLVVLKGKAGQTTAIVTDIEFRRFKRTYKDKETGKMKTRLKAVPYAICTVMTGGFGRITTGSKMVIAGYKLRNHALKGEKCLVLESQYIPEYEDHGERWVVDMIEENRKKNAKKKEGS